MLSINSVSQSPSPVNSGSSPSKSEGVIPLLVFGTLSNESEKSKEREALLAEVARRYYYDPIGGYLCWGINAPNGKAFLGDRIGADNGRGYRIFSFRYKGKQAKYYEHQVVWWLVYGYWPSEIDHINGCRHDNRIENLREVTRTDNTRNACRRKDNPSGVTGVVWHTAAQKWCAQIGVNGQSIHLGLFTNLEDAVEVRKAAETKYGFHPNHGRVA